MAANKNLFYFKCIQPYCGISKVVYSDVCLYSKLFSEWMNVGCESQQVDIQLYIDTCGKWKMRKWEKEKMRKGVSHMFYALRVQFPRQWLAEYIFTFLGI